LPSGAPVADFAPDLSGWLDFLFTPSEEKVYSLGKRSADTSIDAVTFASPGKITSRVVPAYTTLLGFSDGCPVLYAASRGAWRSCGGCDDAPIAGGQPDQNVFGRDNAVLSSDGLFLAVAGSTRGSGVTLWRLRPDPVFDWKFVALSHNTVRGAAGGAVLTAELLKSDGYLTAK